MASYTNMTCLIQLNSHCWDCTNSIRIALNRVYGVTSVTVDSSSDTVKVTGKVDPRDLLLVVQSYDIHARILWAERTPIYPYGYSCADQYWCTSQPQPIPIVSHARGAYYQQQPYCGRQHHTGCNIM
ncbi:hypothetical protein QQ045_015274 [Rhodiola kirilowii]